MAERKIPTPEELVALRALSAAYERLKVLGYRDAMYCPKDGREFWMIEVGSVGIHPCVYEGEWPTGNYWTYDEIGDSGPARPILYKEKDPTT